jgi:hypothetical protein
MKPSKQIKIGTGPRSRTGQTWFWRPVCAQRQPICLPSRADSRPGISCHRLTMSKSGTLKSKRKGPVW